MKSAAMDGRFVIFAFTDERKNKGGSPASHIPAPESFTTVAAFRPWRDLQTIVAGEPTGPP